MSKLIKILSIILIIFALTINFYSVYASDINMNLFSDDLFDTDNNSINTSENPISFDDELQNQVAEPESNAIVSPSSVGTTPEEGLSFSNVLNILLITVGVVLILFAIAIIIRLK